MTTLKPKLYTALAVCALSSSAFLVAKKSFAQSVTENYTVAASVLEANGIVQLREISFGGFMGYGTINIPAVDTATAELTGNLSYFSGAQSGKFLLTANSSIANGTSVTITSTTPHVTLSSGSNTMNLDLNLPNSAAFGSSGQAIFFVGGQISPIQGQPTGSYTGTYSLTATF